MSDPRADLAAERVVLAAVLAGQPIGPLHDVVRPGDFYRPLHEAIFAAALTLTEAGETVDPVTVRAHLERNGQRFDPVYLAELYAEAPLSTSDATWHAAKVTEEARARALVAAGQAIIQAGEARTLEPDEARDAARAALAEALADREKRVHVRVADVLADVLEIAEGKVTPALSTPWPDLDRIITGLAPGRLVVVGARPGVGKSIMGSNLALHFADHHGHAALIDSLEMPPTEVTQRLVAARAKVNLTALSSGRMTETQWQTLREHLDDLRKMPLYIESERTLTGLRNAVLQTQAERSDLSLVVVDYLQLMDAPKSGKDSNRARDLAVVSSGLKTLAMETGTCVVAMAQVNREGVRGGARPTMSDLRESGAIEADADQVILLHHESKENADVAVIVDKNRWGAQGEATLQIQGHFARLVPAAHWSPTRGIA